MTLLFALAVLAVLALVSLVRSFLDGRRAGAVATAARWAVVAAVVSVSTSLLGAVPGAGWSDVGSPAPVVAGIVGLPAAVGRLTGVGARRGSAGALTRRHG